MTDVPRPAVAAVLWGGIVAGTVDVGAACLINALGPVVILQAIASGLLGPDAFRGGLAIAILGYGLQSVMSVVIAACYAMATRWLPAARRRWLVAGSAFGVVVFAVMNYVVVPLSAVAHRPHFSAAALVENLLAMLLFGAIIAYFQRATPPATMARRVPEAPIAADSDPSLDEALEESFPASDPVAIHVDTESPSDAVAPIDRMNRR